MTRKHFKELAETISQLSNLEDKGKMAGIVILVGRQLNPRFDADRFLEGCGLDASQIR
jgi:hypothetical protein